MSDEETITVVGDEGTGEAAPTPARSRQAEKRTIKKKKLKEDTRAYLESFTGDAWDLPSTEELEIVPSWGIHALRSLATKCGLSPASLKTRQAVRDVLEAFRAAAAERESAEEANAVHTPLVDAFSSDEDGDSVSEEIAAKERELAAQEAQLAAELEASRKDEAAARQRDRASKRAAGKRKLDELNRAIKEVEARRVESRAANPHLEESRSRRDQLRSDAGLRDTGLAGVGGAPVGEHDAPLPVDGAEEGGAEAVPAQRLADRPAPRQVIL